MTWYQKLEKQHELLYTNQLRLYEHIKDLSERIEDLTEKIGVIIEAQLRLFTALVNVSEEPDDELEEQVSRLEKLRNFPTVLESENYVF